MEHGGGCEFYAAASATVLLAAGMVMIGLSGKRGELQRRFRAGMWGSPWYCRLQDKQLGGLGAFEEDIVIGVRARAYHVYGRYPVGRLPEDLKG